MVLFHLEIAGFSSGFLGVDVFFVISGYLMAVMYNPLEKANFFVKRARRLLPAYFVVVIATLLIATIFTTPNDYNQVSYQALFATFFASNIGFWMDSSYFYKAEFKPLLHLWSLGVEIQFYLLIPFLYWAFKKVKISFLLVLGASALLCFIALSISPKTAFFWLPFRLWQFLIGVGVAKYIYSGQRAGGGFSSWLGAASLAAIICIPLVNIDGDQRNFVHGHPGLFAFLISIATATTLSFGIPKIVEANPISSLLERIGGYSYSIYLAHFPVIVLFLYEPFSGTVLETDSLSQTLLLSVLVICSSLLLFKFVERPFRSGHKEGRWAVGSAVIGLLIWSVGVTAQKAFIPEKEMLVYQAWGDRSEYRCGKIMRLLNPGARSCETTEHIENPVHRVLLVGNSHADSIKSTFSTVAQAHNVSVYFMVDNRPLMKGGISPPRLFEEAAEKRIDAIVLHYTFGGLKQFDIDQIAALAKERKIQLSFIMPVPVWGEHVPTMLIKNMKNGEGLLSQSINDYQSLHRTLIDDLNKIDYEEFKIYYTADTLCRPNCRLLSDDGRPLYFDSHHLTLTGSEILRNQFDQLILDLD